MSHKKEHTVMVKKVLQELARQQGQTVEAVLEQLFCRVSIVNTGLLIRRQLVLPTGANYSGRIH